MGNESSKSKTKNNRSKNKSIDEKAQDEEKDADRTKYNPHDEKEIATLRKELGDNPEVFVLNQILMSVMFFENYDRDILELSTQTPAREIDLTERLLVRHQKQCFMPDMVFESANRNVKYRSKNDGKIEWLVAERLYVIHDNIEVLDSSDAGHYSSVDKPSYCGYYEESKEHKGFVRIRHQGRNGNKEWPEESETESIEASMKQQINDSGFNTESDYEYSTINQAMTPVSLTISAHHPTGGTSGGGSLPKSCLTPIKVRNEKSENNSDRDSSDDEKRVPNVPLFRKQYYLNSTEFMAHFRKNVFPNELGLVMGFSKKQIYQSKFARDRIFLFDAAYQIVPAITLPWPGILAYEWMWRDRKAGKYVWPTKTMITDVSRLFCQACPNGFLPKRGANPNRSLEWEVTFPRAEKYLETRMSHAQIKAYLYLLTLLKAFVEPKTGNHGLLPRHVRTLMFWECEADYVRWPESRLGSKLLLVLKHLCLNLGNAHLPDYFVKNKNLFGSIPGMYLRSAQEALAKIIEFPVMYFLVALQSLTYVSPGQFYPLPDFERLHKILTSDGLDLGDTKPLLLKKTGTRCKKSREGREQAWNRRYLVQQQKLRKEKLRPKQEDKMNLEAQHSIIPEEFKKVVFEQNKPLGLIKRQQLLTFFIDHFVQVARQSADFGSTRHALLYLRQAGYLVALLDDLQFCNEEVLNYTKRITDKEEECKRKAASQAERRRSFASGTLRVKGMDINVAKLEQSYNEGSLRELPGPSKRGIISFDEPQET